MKNIFKMALLPVFFLMLPGCGNTPNQGLANSKLTKAQKNAEELLKRAADSKAGAQTEEAKKVYTRIEEARSLYAMALDANIDSEKLYSKFKMLDEEQSIILEFATGDPKDNPFFLEALADRPIDMYIYLIFARYMLRFGERGKSFPRISDSFNHRPSAFDKICAQQPLKDDGPRSKALLLALFYMRAKYSAYTLAQCDPAFVTLSLFHLEKDLAAELVKDLVEGLGDANDLKRIVKLYSRENKYLTLQLIYQKADPETKKALWDELPRLLVSVLGEPQPANGDYSVWRKLLDMPKDRP